MTFDEYIRNGGTKTELFRATGVSMPTLRKVEAREPIRLDVADRLATFLGCDAKALATPKAAACPRAAPRVISEEDALNDMHRVRDVVLLVCDRLGYRAVEIGILQPADRIVQIDIVLAMPWWRRLFWGDATILTTVERRRWRG